jgi:photosystem II stability/assembly factor-like uncharacterized protein
MLCLCQIFLAEAHGQWLWNITQEPAGDGATEILSLSCAGQNCIACVLAGDTGGHFFERSTDGGQTWNFQDPGVGAHVNGARNINEVFQIDSLNACAVGDSGMILRTTNGGVTWSFQTSPVNVRFAAVHFSDPMTGIIAGIKSVITTTDGGAHWLGTPIVASDAQYFSFESCHSYGGGKFRVYGYSPGIVYTTSDNWATVDTGEAIADTSGLELFVTFGTGDTIVAYGYIQGLRTSQRDSVIVQSWDGGMHWQPLLHTAFGLGMTTPGSGDTVVASDGLAIAVSSNDGVTWSVDSFNFDFPPEPVPGQQFAIMPNGTILGLFSTGEPGSYLFATTVLPTDGVQTYEWSVYGTHLFPNPATTILNISSVNRDCPLHIYDVLGREALRGELSDAGIASLDVSKLPRGIYMVVLERSGSMIALGMVSIVE